MQGVLQKNIQELWKKAMTGSWGGAWGIAKKRWGWYPGYLRRPLCSE
jgi:hypothetical protein